jgi:hypothetical protein
LPEVQLFARSSTAPECLTVTSLAVDFDVNGVLSAGDITAFQSLFVEFVNIAGIHESALPCAGSKPCPAQ